MLRFLWNQSSVFATNMRGAFREDQMAGPLPPKWLQLFEAVAHLERQYNLDQPAAINIVKAAVPSPGMRKRGRYGFEDQVRSIHEVPEEYEVSIEFNTLGIRPKLEMPALGKFSGNLYPSFNDSIIWSNLEIEKHDLDIYAISYYGISRDTSAGPISQRPGRKRTQRSAIERYIAQHYPDGKPTDVSYKQIAKDFHQESGRTISKPTISRAFGHP
jgi:hypothetical protein